MVAYIQTKIVPLTFPCRCELEYSQSSDHQIVVTSSSGSVVTSELPSDLSFDDLPRGEEAESSPLGHLAYDSSYEDTKHFSAASSWSKPNQMPPPPHEFEPSSHTAGYASASPSTIPTSSNPSQSTHSSYTSNSFGDEYGSSYGTQSIGGGRQKRARADEAYMATQHLDIPRTPIQGHRQGNSRGRLPMVKQQGLPHDQPDLVSAVAELSQRGLSIQDFKANLSQLFIARGVDINQEQAVGEEPILRSNYENKDSTSRTSSARRSRPKVYTQQSPSTTHHTGGMASNAPGSRAGSQKQRPYACVAMDCHSSFETNSALESVVSPAPGTSMQYS